MFYLFLLAVISSNLLGLSVSGTVLDSDTNEPLGNVNISIIGTDSGTTTNYLGEFKLDDIENDIQEISFSLIGYKNYSKELSSKKVSKNFTIQLEKEPLQWKAVNVMGLIPSKHSPEVTQIISST